MVISLAQLLFQILPVRQLPVLVLFIHVTKLGHNSPLFRTPICVSRARAIGGRSSWYPNKARAVPQSHCKFQAVAGVVNIQHTIPVACILQPSQFAEQGIIFEPLGKQSKLDRIPRELRRYQTRAEKTKSPRVSVALKEVQRTKHPPHASFLVFVLPQGFSRTRPASLRVFRSRRRLCEPFGFELN